MAKWIFKVKKVTANVAEILDAKAYDVDNLSDPTVLTPADFDDFYENHVVQIKLKKNDSGSDEPWTQHKPHFHASLTGNEHNLKESITFDSGGDLAGAHTAILNRLTPVGGTPVSLYISVGSGATFNNIIAPRYIAYCKSNEGQGSPSSGSTTDLHQQIIESAVTGDGTATEAEWTYHPDNNLVKGVYEINTASNLIRAGCWLKDENNSGSTPATTRARQILAVVKVAFNSGTNKYTYRLYIDNTGGTPPPLLMNPTTSSGKLGVYSHDVSSHGFNSSNAIVLVDHGDVTHRQPGVPDLGSTFYSAHIFRYYEMNPVQPVIDDGTSGKPSIVGIKPDPISPFYTGWKLAPSNLEMGEHALIVGTANNSTSGSSTYMTAEDSWATNATWEVDVIASYNGNSAIKHANDTFVEVQGTASVGINDDGTANMDWFNFGNLPKYYLGQRQDYGYVYLDADVLPPSTFRFNATTTVNGCVIGFTVTELTGSPNGIAGSPPGYATPMVAHLIGPNDSSPDAWDGESTVIQTKEFSSTGGPHNFASLGHSTYYIPTVNPNGTYSIQFSEDKENNEYRTDGYAKRKTVVMDNCPYFTVSTDVASGCNLLVTVGNIYGFQDSGRKIKLKLYHLDNSPLVNGSSTHYVQEIESPAAGSEVTKTFDLSGAVGICENSIIKIRFTDETDANITFEALSGAHELPVTLDHSSCPDCFAASASANGCIVSFNVTSLALPSNQFPMKGHLWKSAGPGDTPNFSERLTTPAAVSFSTTGTKSFTSLNTTADPAYDIPTNNPNGTYNVMFSDADSHTTLSDHNVTTNSVTVDSCPWFVLLANNQSGCEIQVNVNSVHGYTSNSIKVKLYNSSGAALVNGSGSATPFEHTITNPDTNSNNSKTFDVSTAVPALCSGDTVRVAVIDVSTGANITMQAHGAHYEEVVLGSGCGSVDISTTVAQSNCQITGQVNSISCVPAYSGGSNRKIKAEFWKSVDGEFTHLDGSDVIKTNTFGSAVTGFNLTGGVVSNGDYQVKWYYQTTSGGSWTHIKTQSQNVNSCPTFSGSATQSTSPKCGIAITVNWSATSNLGNTIRAIVFLDANGNGALDGGENAITGATLHSDGSSLNFQAGSENGVDFSQGSGSETQIVILDALSDPNAKYIVEFQSRGTDNSGPFAPLNDPGFGLSTSDTHKSVTVNNCTPCANNASPFYYFQVSGGNIVTNNGTARGVKRCDTNAFTAFSGGYCKTDASSSNWTIIGKAGGTGSSGQWGSSDVTACADGPGQADGQSITVRLYGSHLQTGQPLGVFTSGSSWTTPLADGYYIACNTTFPTPDADPCTTTHAFQIDANGKIVSTNGLSGSNLRAAAFSGTFAARAATHTWGTGSNFCYSGTAFTYEPVVHSSEAVARGSLGCGGKTGGTLYLFGNAITGLYVHTANNAAPSNRKADAAGWYTTCVEPAAGTNPCASTEHFLQITSAHGDWDGKIYNSSGSPVTVHATSADWFEESPISGWTAASVGTGWTGVNPAAAEAINLCSDSYVNANTGSNILYISGTLVNGRTNADKLRIYRGAGLTNPLAAGWYRYCGTPPVPKVNGVPEFREKFNCYGNPFSWWSAKPRDTLVLDGNGFLTNGISGKMDWWRDAAVKDLTDTNNDLGIYEWYDEGATKKATIQRTTVSRSCITNHQNGGGSTQNKEILQFTSSKKRNLTRAPFGNHPDQAQGIDIISSVKTSATEVTAAIVFDTDSASGMILQLSDIYDSSGGTPGSWVNLEDSAKAGNTITESVLVFKKSGSSQVTLQTQKRTLSWNSSNESASWGSWTQSAALTASVSGFAIAVIKATAEGHMIRINGDATASNTSVSLFCDGSKGITNLNSEIGGDDGKLCPTMKLAEIIVYDDELNYDEMQELEGWLAERWCKQLNSDSHPWYADGPNCSTCESVCCEAEVTVSTAVTGSSHKVEITSSYKSSEDVWGYQFKLSGLAGLNITPGLWKQGDTITTTVSGKTFSVTFSDPFVHGFKNYLVSDANNDIWVVGHFYDSGTGSYDSILPPKATATEFMVTTITETSSSKVQNWGSITGTIVTNNSKLDNPAAPHPILATYYPNQVKRQETPVRTYNGDSTGDGTVTMTDVEAIISRIPRSSSPFDLEVSSGAAKYWMETLDANGKGWLDITDAVTTILHLKTNGTNGGSGTPISNSAVVKSTATPTNLLSVAACINRMKPTECEPCPCPDLLEPEECISRVWISDISPVDKNQQFAAITVRYQSSCCIDGYRIELGGYDPTKIGTTGFHDGVVYAPSTGTDIGQQATETHSRSWLHGTTLDPTYSGDVALENGADIWLWQASSTAGYPMYLQSPPKTSYNFPIVWGMSIATLASAAAAGSKQINSDKIEDMIRMGFGCIPRTCAGESKVLTKFVVNMRTFMAMPYIKNYRLVTNDDLATPISFDGGSGITWTGDGSDSNSTVDANDWTEVLLYMGLGWSRTTSFSDSSEQTSYRNKVKVFSAENDDSYIDIVDALTVSNHLLQHGPDNSNTSAEVVPKDCCECTLPGSFTVKAVPLPCNCWEEGYIKGREGEVTVNWSASSDATSYTILRFVESRKTTTTNDKIGMAGWHLDNQQSSVAATVGSNILYNAAYSANYKNQLEHQRVGEWQTVAQFDSTVTTWIDRNPPRFEKCCPDDVLPKVTYVVLARNDCGEVSTQTSYEPDCCGTAPIANNVAIGERTVNQQLTFMADAYHPMASPPFGGVNKAASAVVTFTGVPADNVTMKVVDYAGTSHTFKFKAGGGTSTSTMTFINTTSENTVTKLGDALVAGLAAASVKITGVNSSGAVTMTQNDGSGNTNKEHTICGNTKITVSDITAITLPATGRFTGGNVICDKATPGFPVTCEDLMFTIYKVKYHSPVSGRGRFVGPGDAGQPLPRPNRNGRWTWVPPTGYIGDVTFAYRVRNESGCDDVGKITVTYKPIKVKLNCSTFPCNHPKYGQAILKFDRPEGVIGEVRILRKLSTDGSAWDTSRTSSQLVKDVKNRSVIINLTTNTQKTITYLDTTAPIPDECCENDVAYDYMLVICQINDYVIASQQQGRQTKSVLYCTESSVCRVTIPCCELPNNPIPELCVSACDGVAAETSFVFHSSNFNSVNNGTIAITNTAGTTKTYKIKNSGSPNASNQEFSAGASRAAAAENLATLIESGDGHDGTIFAYDSAGKRYNDGSKDFSDGKLVLKQVAVGNAGNTAITTAANFDNTTSTNATAFDCGFDAADHPAVRISWSPIDTSDNATGYYIWRRRKGETKYELAHKVRVTQSENNPDWNAATGKYSFVDDELKITKYCEPAVYYQYTATAINDNGESGNPNDSDWETWSSSSASQGDACSPGGTSIWAGLTNCPPSPCLKAHDLSICLERTHSIDLSKLTGCLPRKADGTIVPHSYSIVSSAAWVTPALSGTNNSILSFDTHGIDFDTVGGGPHSNAIVWRLTISDSSCSSTTNASINITLVDCGCPCPDDEKDYTICDVNFDNAEYIANDASSHALIRELVDSTGQIPFSLGREGGQNLRKGKPYMVSKGEIDQS